MKRIATTIFLIFLCMSLFSQGLNPERTKQTMHDNRVKTQVKFKYRPDSDKGTKVSMLQFDENGNVIEEINYKPDGSIMSKYKYKYNANGFKTEYLKFNIEASKEVLNYSQHFKYDYNNNKIEEKVSNDGESYFTFKYKYDLQGKLKTKSQYTSSGAFMGKEEYAYSNGTVTILSYDGANNQTGKAIEKYENNLLVETIKYGANGSAGMKNTYKYNQEGMLLEEKKYNQGRFIEKLNYRYNPNGFVEQIAKEDADGQKFINNSYFYDNRFNLIEEKWFDGVPDDYSKKSYSYDKTNKVTQMDSYYSLYRYNVLYKYTYTYY
ncbi:hypothetical protein ACFLSA_02030 [Bacteroidota bacterium]